MLSSFNQIYKKILKKNLKQLILLTSKPFIILELFLYWGVIIVGTFLQLNYLSLNKINSSFSYKSID